ncbi:hypothetical protein ACHJH3_06915 [Campylobacter sp. MOP7]|uniref:hypothetical protein n=1 Tax=Campylobacter canis TaxID=3378588 RepID=UPI00387EDEBC
MKKLVCQRLVLRPSPEIVIKFRQNRLPNRIYAWNLNAVEDSVRSRVEDRFLDMIKLLEINGEESKFLFVETKKDNLIDSVDFSKEIAYELNNGGHIVADQEILEVIKGYIWEASEKFKSYTLAKNEFLVLI